MVAGANGETTACGGALRGSSEGRRLTAKTSVGPPRSLRPPPILKPIRNPARLNVNAPATVSYAQCGDS